MKSRANPFLLQAILISAITAPAAFAANTTIVWGNAATPTNYNSGTYDWNTATNWNAGAGPVPFGATTIAQLKGSSSQNVIVNLSSSITIGAISRAGSQTNFTLQGAAITMDGTGITATTGANAPIVFANGEAAISSNQNNTTFVNLTVNSNIIMLNTNLGIGGASNNINARNQVTIGGNITNGDSATRQLNFRGGVGTVAYNTQVTGSIGATLGTGGGGITIQNLITGSSPVNLQGNIGAASGTGAAITISNTATGIGNFNISGTIGQSVSAITQNSATSTTALSGSNSNFAGTITVTSGALSFINTTAKSGTTTVANGATLGLGVSGTNAFTSSDVDSLFGSGLSGVTMGATSNVGIDSSNGSFTYSTSVASTAKGLNKLGVNTVILTGTNVYTGPTIVSGGILQIGNASTTGSLSTSSAITNNAQITFKRSDNILQGTHFSSAGISGTGSLVKDGVGSLTLNVSNTYGGSTTVSAGTLSIANGGSFTTTIVDNTSLVVGNVSGNSLLHIQTGGAGTASRLQVGTISGGNGAIYNQGTLTVNGSANVGNFALGYATGAYGYYRHDTSTTTTVNEIGIGTSSATTTANLGGNGVMDLLQGKVANAGWFSMNRGDATQYSQLNISGGTFELANSATQVGLFMNNNDTQNNKGGQAVINVSGTGSLTSAGTATELDLMRISQPTTATSMLGVLNIGTGGTVQTNVIKATQANGTALVNFNGGTLKANNTGVTLMGGSNIDGAYIYSGGGIIDTNGKDVTISQNLLAPAGSGVSSISVTANGTGYIGRPVVYITGGGGTGATGVADFDPVTGQVTGITITNPGTGYTSAPTVTITGGGGTSPTLGSVTTAANTSGGLTKSNTGTLTLSGTNSYAGDTTVKAGTLALSSAGTISNSANLIIGDAGSSGAVLDVTGKSAFAIDGTQALKGIGTVNIGSGKTITIDGTHAVGNAGTAGGVGTQTVTGNLAYGSTSLFEWDINTGTATYDKVALSGSLSVDSNAVFKVVSSTAFSDGFWATSKTWSDIFASNNIGFDVNKFLYVANSSSVSTPTDYGSFSISGSTLTWTAVPEPTSALVGLLITAGLLRRRRA